MNRNWQKLAKQLTVSIAVEVSLNVVGLDYIANCMEFVLLRQESYVIAANTTQAQPPIFVA